MHAAISVTQAPTLYLRIRALTKGVAEAYYANHREALEFPTVVKIRLKQIPEMVNCAAGEQNEQTHSFLCRETCPDTEPFVAG